MIGPVIDSFDGLPDHHDALRLVITQYLSIYCEVSIMSTHPKPTVEPTPLEDVRLVVLGGERAGIHSVVKE